MISALRHVVAPAMRPLSFPGRYRLYTLASQILGDEPLPFVVSLRHGVRVKVHSPVWQQLFYLGDYEREVRLFLEREASAGGTVLDVGANVGVLALPIAKRAKTVIAFEALKSNYDLLVENVALNRLTNVTPVYAAVSDASGTISVPVPGEEWSGNYSLAMTGERTVEIAAVTLDDFCASRSIAKIDVIKIDIEGSETRALRGARQLFSSGMIRKTIIEFNPYWLNRMGSSADELYDLFESYRLRVHQLTRFGKATPISREECMSKLVTPDSYLNLVLIAT